MTQHQGLAWEKTSGLGGVGLRPAGQSLRACPGQPSPGSKLCSLNPPGKGGFKALVLGERPPHPHAQHQCPLDKGDSNAPSKSHPQQERTGVIA